ncbi:hypothetical protein GCM10028812_53770 [Ancylobacter sonchi]
MSVKTSPSEIAHWCGKVGYNIDDNVKKWYRMKFGIYKGGEPGRQFVVKYRNIRSSNSIDELWN